MLVLESALLFLGIPLVLQREWIRVPWIFPLMIVAVFATLWLRRPSSIRSAAARPDNLRLQLTRATIPIAV